MTDRPEAGQAEEIEPGLRRVVAPNPSPMTHWGTNTYLVGSGALAVIDPGPDDPAHLEALRAAIGGARVETVIVTHAHLDHSGLAPRLAQETGAEVLAFGTAADGRSPMMERLAAQGLAGGGEGVDAGFRPHRRLRDGERLSGDGWQFEVVHTPGHFAGHLSLALGDALFTGDHVMGWASTLISPPDGDLSAFMASCLRLSVRGDRVFHPGHGAPVTDPAGRLEWLIAHRKGREAQILAVLDGPPATAAEIAARIYTDIPPALLPAAGRNVLAHLVDLTERNQVVASPDLGTDARFARR